MKPDYERTTITVPVSLKRKMKKFRSRVNWSAVACEAFEQKMEEMGPIEEITSIADAVKRLKNMKEEQPESQTNQNALEAGRHWAMNYATRTQLGAIEALHDKVSDDWEAYLLSPEGWHELTLCIDPDSGDRPTRTRRRHRGPRGHEPRGGGGPGRSRGVWRAILDQRPDSKDFFLGFANGAIEVWKEIKDQL